MNRKSQSQQVRPDYRYSPREWDHEIYAISTVKPSPRCSLNVCHNPKYANELRRNERLCMKVLYGVFVNASKT